MFLIWSKGFKINFQNRKWNYPNRKWNYFSHFQASAEKTSFTKCFSFDPRGPKLIFKTGNGIIQTGNGFISPTSRPLMKKFLFLNVLLLIQEVQNIFYEILAKVNHPPFLIDHFISGHLNSKSWKSSHSQAFLQLIDINVPIMYHFANQNPLFKVLNPIDQKLLLNW